MDSSQLTLPRSWGFTLCLNQNNSLISSLLPSWLFPLHIQSHKVTLASAIAQTLALISSKMNSIIPIKKKPTQLYLLHQWVKEAYSEMKWVPKFTQGKQTAVVQGREWTLGKGRTSSRIQLEILVQKLSQSKLSHETTASARNQSPFDYLPSEQRKRKSKALWRSFSPIPPPRDRA